MPRRASRDCIPCDRQSRKVFEALQAWRRAHEGKYPPTLAKLAESGFLKLDSVCCPRTLTEDRNASSAHALSRSAGDGFDPPGLYEYEMSAVVDKTTREYMREAIPRGEIKAELLRRPFWEQVPILRCSGHRAQGGLTVRSPGPVFRNFTASGNSYWSGGSWECEWSDVPETGRHALVVRGLPGPPFHSQIASTNPNELDLRKHYNACGERAWWWGVRYIEALDPKLPKVRAPDLSELMAMGRARSHRFGTESYWLDGVIQLQGKTVPAGPVNRAFGREVYPWRTAAIPVGRKVALASILLGCIWEDRDGSEVASLVWQYTNGVVKKSALVYGKSVRRFWRTAYDNHSAPLPVLQFTADPAVETRIYSAVCENPLPDEDVAGVVIESNPASPAAPFILAITVHP